MAKKYFWLKLKDDFFRDKRIKKLRRIAGGDTYTVIYLKMQLLSLKNEGVLFYEGVEDSFYEEIALEIDEDVENVKVTIMFLTSNGLLEETEENQFALIETMNSIGSETQAAERVRKHREIKKNEQKVLHCNAPVTTSNTEIEKELELELDIELEIEKPNVQSEIERDFTEFYQHYPVKKGKANAVKAYAKARKNKHSHETIMNGLMDYKQELQIKGTDKQFIKQPSTFLNGEHFNDEFDLTQYMNKGKQYSVLEDLANGYSTNGTNIINGQNSLPQQIESGRKGISWDLL